MTNLDELERLHAELLALPKWYITTNEGGIESLEKPCAIAKALPGLLAELRALREVASMAARLTDMATMGGVGPSWVGPLRALSASLDAVPGRRLTEAEASARDWHEPHP